MADRVARRKLAFIVRIASPGLTPPSATASPKRTHERTPCPAHTLRLILGDQLNPQHSWFATPRADVVYVLMEMRQETDYVLHHAQKIIAIFAGMRELARQLQEAGHRVHYLRIDDPANLHSLTDNLSTLLQHCQAQVFEYQDPDDYRLDQQLQDFLASSPCGISASSYCVDSEHFYTQRHEAAELFTSRKQWLMASFYRHMRKRHHVLIDGADKPAGGQWNFDPDDRKSSAATNVPQPYLGVAKARCRRVNSPPEGPGF